MKDERKLTRIDAPAESAQQPRLEIIPLLVVPLNPYPDRIPEFYGPYLCWVQSQNDLGLSKTWLMTHWSATASWGDCWKCSFDGEGTVLAWADIGQVNPGY